LTVKSFHISTWVGPQAIYMGQANSDTAVTTVSGQGIQSMWGTSAPEISIHVTFDEGTVRHSGTIGGTAGPDVRFDIPPGATKVTAIAVKASWTKLEEENLRSSGPDTLEWSVDVPLIAMGMTAPAKENQ
jgi:hypothetical protein